ncbi:DNA helicase, ATP-dependent, RecQ type [Kipferlia bialata]|nr:DNA helicase, ATP-dependent, RecQ type [Kipferlia bialata]|eukprot:g7490.t1
MPTGAGKSIIYQLAALCRPGVAIVVSPLIALIRNQVTALQQKDIGAASITGQTSLAERRAIEGRLTSWFVTNKPLKILYVTPEGLDASLGVLIDRLSREGKLSMVAIDEVHCISKWGHDFRPAYLKLNGLKQRWPGVPVCGMTATATRYVQRHVIEGLEMQRPHRVRTSFDRPNIFYSVLPEWDRAHAPELIRRTFKDQCGIIYVGTRGATEDVCRILGEYGLQALPYHAGMSAKDRNANQRQWENGTVNIICATIAFGMGIDKPDVRFVMHWCMPDMLESFYQESGRAGRDGQPSASIVYCDTTFWDRIHLGLKLREEGLAGEILLFEEVADGDESPDKAEKQKELEIVKARLSSMYKMFEYCTVDPPRDTDTGMIDGGARARCRREYVLGYFSETLATHSDRCCDVCDSAAGFYRGMMSGSANCVTYSEDAEQARDRERERRVEREMRKRPRGEGEQEGRGRVRKRQDPMGDIPMLAERYEDMGRDRDVGRHPDMEMPNAGQGVFMGVGRTVGGPVAKPKRKNHRSTRVYQDLLDHGAPMGELGVPRFGRGWVGTRAVGSQWRDPKGKEVKRIRKKDRKSAAERKKERRRALERELAAMSSDTEEETPFEV